jgi:hypothetical protein
MKAIQEGLRAGRGFVRRAAGDAGALTLDDMRALVAYAASLRPEQPPPTFSAHHKMSYFGPT